MGFRRGHVDIITLNTQNRPAADLNYSQFNIILEEKYLGAFHVIFVILDNSIKKIIILLFIDFLFYKLLI